MVVAPVLPGWHPSHATLELIELVVGGVLGHLPDGALGELPEAAHAGVLVEDAEGTPVAELTFAPDGVPRVRGLRPFAHGPVRSHRRTPAQVREAVAGRPVIAVSLTGPAPASQVAAARAAAAEQGAVLLWLVMVGDGWDAQSTGGLGAEALWRAARRLADPGELVVPLALPADQVELAGPAMAAYGAAEIRSAGVSAARREVHPAFTAELARAVRPAAQRGLVLFFTGLSGSGKSTVAKALAEALIEDGRRTLSMLDGDEVRRLLSAGLGFSVADREANIRRIGFVAAEVARHGGTAICAPIAPFAAGRAEVRSMVEQAGGDLLLVHVATPLAECERRDRKGMYAKARRGEIADFTGISSPYEPPSDADIVLDTSDISVQECVNRLWRMLQERGYLADDVR